jgi:hypothetical protein
MNLSSFLEHWGLHENPFRAEEARHDPVFGRLGHGPTSHPDFEKIVGDFSRPSTAIVFGEKGSGKTAIRLQIADRVRVHNDQFPDRRLLLLAYDDLNPFLDRFAAASGLSTEDEDRDVLKALKKLRLVDHMDAVIHLATVQIVDRLLSQHQSDAVDLGENPIKAMRRADPVLRQDMALLQAVYDRGESGAARTRFLRQRIKPPVNRGALAWNALVVLGWLLPALVAYLSTTVSRDYIGAKTWMWAFGIAMTLWGFILVKRLLWDRWRLSRLAKRVTRSTRTLPRSTDDVARALAPISASDRSGSVLPTGDNEESRYAMLGRLKRVLAHFGYSGVIVVVDRVDEPTLVAGDPDRMRAVVWPMLHNKFLQQDAVGVKLLLPIELRHELFRESSAFFQEARLDKQNLIERLSWTGAMLYDLCNARMRACQRPGAKPVALIDLFDEDVTRQDVVDALDQMHQPRDAFKLIYQCMQEHCSNVTEEQARWRIPRPVLDTVKKQQSERVQMLYRGVRPA